MNHPPSPPLTEPPLRFSVEAARQLLEQALEAEKSVEDTETDLAQKRAINAYTGASALLPPEVIATAAPEQRHSS
ncbi:MAG: hypothetical protein WAW39_19775 [Prosthecobacter sp.]|uniref:hypothetical protein n=1 Tax=Prosthecobacter sp. TaxID=1965333 RepID=UPI003BB02C9C